jgi:thioredoxin 1
VLLQLCDFRCSEAKGRPFLLLAIVAAAWLLPLWAGRRRKGSGIRMTTWKIGVVVVLAAAVVTVFSLKRGNGEDAKSQTPVDAVPAAMATANAAPSSGQTQGLPRLVDLGRETCIPCKMMIPVLAQLRQEYAGRLNVEFINIQENPDAAGAFGIKLIPTQIFIDASGKELFRHEGFFSKEDILAKWKELGVNLAGSSNQTPAFERLAPAQPDARPKNTICYMCEGTIDTRSLVTVQTDKGPVRLCSPHCYCIMYSCLTEDKTGFEKRVTVTDWADGKPISLTEATFLCGQDEVTGRPWIKAFAGKDAAMKERTAGGGNIMRIEPLLQQEMSHRCGFCDRACDPQDAAEVIVEGGVRTWGCCSHCALGVAARTGKNIEVHERDRLTKQPIVVKTLDGKVALLEPSTAVAWFGQRQKPDGTWASAGCFHQGFFTNADNLKKWVEQNPSETGRLISISQALADKMKLSPEQIKKACKIGECSPK